MKRKKMRSRNDWRVEWMPWTKWFKRKHRAARHSLKNKGMK